MSTGRKFMCAEADYLTAYGIPLRTAARYAQRFTPRQVVELHQAGIEPDTANVQATGLDSLAIIALLKP